MSFLFNFDSPTDDPGSANHETETGCHNAVNGKNGNADQKAQEPALEITEFLDDTIKKKLNMKVMQFGEHCLKIVDTSTVETKLLEEEELKSTLGTSQSLLNAITSHSDLESGVYEGGLKIWECGVDLAEFLSSHPVGAAIEMKEKSVLELGCGAGLPGLYCCKCGAKRVDFQDYNEEVLKLLTHTNVVNNTEGSSCESLQCRYFAGDWSSFSTKAEKQQLKYDVILSAETIYNTENYPKLHEVFTKTLADNGIILVAAKVYYFGVGGSVDAFMEYIGSQNCFNVEIVHSISKGVPRKILSMHWLPSQLPKCRKGENPISEKNSSREGAGT